MNIRSWNAAVMNPSDSSAVAVVGLESYHDAMGEGYDHDSEQWQDLIRIVAKMLCTAFPKISRDEIANLKICLEGGGPFIEPAIGEPPLEAVAHHLLIEGGLVKGQNTTLVEVLAIAHDIEAHIRPGLLRLLWVAEKATGIHGKTYSAYHLDAKGRERSVGHALNRLKAWSAQQSSPILDETENSEFDVFLTSISRKESEKIGVDELRNWVAHRSFIFNAEGIILGLHPAPGTRIFLSRAEVTAWRRLNIGLVCIFLAFQSMFLALAAAYIPNLELNHLVEPLSRGFESTT